MKTSDKNKIFEYLNSTSYSINDFKIIEKAQVAINNNNPQHTFPISTITYKETPLQFEISNPYETYDQYRYCYKIFGPRWSNYLPENQVGYFADVISGFQSWLDKQIQSYRQEISETDLWEEYLKVPKAINFEKILNLIPHNLLKMKRSS